MMQAAAWAVHSVTDPYSRGRDFYYVTVVLLAVCLVAGVLATAATAHREGDGAGWKAALLVALSPALILAAFINWDLFAMALAAGGLAAWAAQRQYLAGVLLGLAVATSSTRCCSSARCCCCACGPGGCASSARSSARAWSPGWWSTCRSRSRRRPMGPLLRVQPGQGRGLGSVWYLFEHYNVPVLGDSAQSTLNLMSSGAFALACVGIAFLALAAPRRPRLPQLCFLLLAAFLILNKVWSPQYVIWLVPLAVLARPRVWPYVLWQLAEVAYFFGIWGYFVNMYQSPAGVTVGWYFVILAARLVSVGLVA